MQPSSSKSIITNAVNNIPENYTNTLETSVHEKIGRYHTTYMHVYLNRFACGT